MIRNELTLLGVVLFVLLTVGGNSIWKRLRLRPLRFINARVRPFGSRGTGVAAAVWPAGILDVSASELFYWNRSGLTVGL